MNDLIHKDIFLVFYSFTSCYMYLLNGQAYNLIKNEFKK